MPTLASLIATLNDGLCRLKDDGYCIWKDMIDDEVLQLCKMKFRKLHSALEKSYDFGDDSFDVVYTNH